MRIYVTGSRGYLGSALTEYLRRQGWTVVENQCDIRDYRGLLDELITATPQLIIHLAACSTIEKCEQHPRQALTTNAIGTRNIVSIMKTIGCRNIIYASSEAVYGSSNYPVTEYSKVNPSSVYGITKLLGELCIRNSRVNYVIMRMSNVGGFHSHFSRHSEGTRLWGRLYNATRNGHPFTVYGIDYHTRDGTEERDYLHIQDAVHAYYLTALRLTSPSSASLPRPLRSPSSASLPRPLRSPVANRSPSSASLPRPHPRIEVILNLASGYTFTVGEIVRMWQDHLYHQGSPVLDIVVGSRRPGDPDSIAMTTHQLFQYLSWRPRLAISDIIGSYY